MTEALNEETQLPVAPIVGAHGESRLLRLFASVSFIACAGTFTYIVIRHLMFQGFTEPMEGDVLQHIERIAKGLPLYPAPSGEFVALAHMPLFYYFSAPLYFILGDTLTGPRMVSSVAALLSGAIITGIAWRESRSRSIGALAGALFFAGYRIMDAYLTCALPDSLMLFFVLTGLWFLSYGRNRIHDVIWLLAFALAFWTKLHGAIYFGFAVAYALVLRPAPAHGETRLPKWIVLLALVIGGPIAYVLIGRALGERFFFYTFFVPRNWEHAAWFSIRRSIFVVACIVPFAMLLSAAYFRATTRFSRTTRPWLSITPVAWFVVTSLGTSLFTMTTAGSSNNHYIPFMASLSATAALGVHVIQRSTGLRTLSWQLALAAIASSLTTYVALRSHADHPVSVVAPVAIVVAFLLFATLISRARHTEHVATLAALVLVLGQFAVSSYYLPDYLPSREYNSAVAQLRDEVSRLDGRVVWVPYGNVPGKLTGLKFERAPSWVALSDVDRQLNVRNTSDRDLSVFRKHIEGMKDLYILSNSTLDDYPVWGELAPHVKLVRDFGNQFAGLKQIAPHWYVGEGFPRYLYHCSAPPASLANPNAAVAATPGSKD